MYKSLHGNSKIHHWDFWEDLLLLKETLKMFAAVCFNVCFKKLIHHLLWHFWMNEWMNIKLKILRLAACARLHYITGALQQRSDVTLLSMMAYWDLHWRPKTSLQMYICLFLGGNIWLFIFFSVLLLLLPVSLTNIIVHLFAPYSCLLL